MYPQWGPRQYKAWKDNVIFAGMPRFVAHWYGGERSPGMLVKRQETHPRPHGKCRTMRRRSHGREMRTMLGPAGGQPSFPQCDERNTGSSHDQ
jgi:hypothetical protein